MSDARDEPPGLRNQAWSLAFSHQSGRHRRRPHVAGSLVRARRGKGHPISGVGMDAHAVRRSVCDRRRRCRDEIATAFGRLAARARIIRLGLLLRRHRRHHRCAPGSRRIRGNVQPSAPFLKGGIDKHIAEPPTGERRRPCRSYSVLANLKIVKKNGRSTTSRAAATRRVTGSFVRASSP
jgi:hypothetical protein